jgi:hypothetical protein
MKDKKQDGKKKDSEFNDRQDWHEDKLDREAQKEKKQDSIIGKVDSGTRKHHADQPMAGSEGKKGKGKADMRVAGLDTGDTN